MSQYQNKHPHFHMHEKPILLKIICFIQFVHIGISLTVFINSVLKVSRWPVLFFKTRSISCVLYIRMAIRQIKNNAIGVKNNNKNKDEKKRNINIRELSNV